MLKIYKETAPILREKSKDVEVPLSTFDYNFFLKMKNYVQKSQKNSNSINKIAVGVSAVQLGLLKKIIYIRFSKNEEYAIANPKIIKHAAKKCYLGSSESCLSVEDKYFGFVPRYLFIEIEYYDIIKKIITRKIFHEYQAIVIQHELDHLNGVLYIDKLSKNIESDWYEI